MAPPCTAMTKKTAGKAGPSKTTLDRGGVPSRKASSLHNTSKPKQSHKARRLQEELEDLHDENDSSIVNVDVESERSLRTNQRRALFIPPRGLNNFHDKIPQELRNRIYDFAVSKAEVWDKVHEFTLAGRERIGDLSIVPYYDTNLMLVDSKITADLKEEMLLKATLVINLEPIGEACNHFKTEKCNGRSISSKSKTMQLTHGMPDWLVQGLKHVISRYHSVLPWPTHIDTKWCKGYDLAKLTPTEDNERAQAEVDDIVREFPSLQTIKFVYDAGCHEDLAEDDDDYDPHRYVGQDQTEIVFNAEDLTPIFDFVPKESTIRTEVIIEPVIEWEAYARRRDLGWKWPAPEHERGPATAEEWDLRAQELLHQDDYAGYESDAEEYSDGELDSDGELVSEWSKKRRLHEKKRKLGETKHAQRERCGQQWRLNDYRVDRYTHYRGMRAPAGEEGIQGLKIEIVKDKIDRNTF